VSLGLPVFNGGRFLASCLDSLLAQTYPHFELIISDNASTDETAAICDRYARRDPRIRYQRLAHNHGAAWNHNRVLKQARGTYFRWCGADDRVDPRFLEACVDALEQRPEAVLAYPLSVVIDAADQPMDRTSDRLNLDAGDPVVRFRQLLGSWNTTHNPFYGVIRADALMRVRPIGTFLANDRALLAELSLKGPFLRVEGYLMLRRRHTANVERTREIEQRFMDPRATGYWAREWRMLHEHLLSVFRADDALRTKLRLIAAVGSWAVEIRSTLVWELRDCLVNLVRRLRTRREWAHHGVGR
jgi:glycosyltransferase involved in cell wall biosynthesis